LSDLKEENSKEPTLEENDKCNFKLYICIVYIIFLTEQLIVYMYGCRFSKIKAIQKGGIMKARVLDLEDVQVHQIFPKKAVF